MCILYMIYLTFPQEGDMIYWRQHVRIHHMTTLQYLLVQPNGSMSIYNTTYIIYIIYIIYSTIYVFYILIHTYFTHLGDVIHWRQHVRIRHMTTLQYLLVQPNGSMSIYNTTYIIYIIYIIYSTIYAFYILIHTYFTHLGDVIHWRQHVRIRHMTTLQYLLVQPNGSMSMTTDNNDPLTVFRLHPVNEVRKACHIRRL